MSRGVLYRMAGALRPLDALKARLGLWRAPDEVTEGAAALLVAVAERFLRAGGVVTPSAWLGLSQPERGALVAAGDRITAERAGVSAVAAKSPSGFLSVLGVLDGGRAAADIELSQIAGAASRRNAAGGAVPS